LRHAARSGWAGIRIHVIDIVQPPGIGMPPIADIDPRQAMVAAALAAKTSAEAVSSMTRMRPSCAHRRPS
jgi:hypothetical protein